MTPEPPLQSLTYLLGRHKIDAILISQPDNRRYLSGYTATDHSITESSGFLLIPRRGVPKLLTDFRFKIQAERDTSGFDIILYKKGLVALLKTLLPRLAITTLAFESSYLLHSQHVALQKISSSLGVQLLPLEGTVERLRQVKTEYELAAIQHSVTLNEQVFQHVLPSIKPGLTEIQVALMLENTMRQLGAERPSFDTIVASGPNGALPHAVPSDRRLQSGEPIIIDMGVVASGYCSDMTRTIVLGTPDDRTVALFRLVRHAQLAGLAALRAGVPARDVDAAARTVITDAGYGHAFGHALGHGVGLAVHESPSLSFRNRKRLRPGMVVTIEPGIYIDGWGGVRLENMATITSDGCQILNHDTTFLDL